MTAEEQKELDELEVKMKGEISAGKQITADDFKRYAYLVKKWRTSFVHVPADPYWSDPATWPEWARFRVANPDRREFWSSERPLIHDSPSTPYWLFGVGKTTECHDRRLIYADWKESMVERSMAI